MEYFNVDQYKDEFPVLEAGEYLATISKVEDYNSGQSGSTTLLVQFKTENGSVRAFLGIYNDDADKRRKSYVRLANIARACGLGGQILPTQLIGRNLVIEVTKTMDPNTGRYRNDVGFNFKPAPGSMPVQTASQGFPAQEVPSAPTASGLPWD